MTHNTDNTIASAKERYLVEDSFVETLDTQVQTEPSGTIKADDGRASAVNAQEDGSAPNQVKKQDEFMESVKAFIRNIDINTL